MAVVPYLLQSRRDNLSTMLFVAALFHGVLILGISFTAGEPPQSSSDAESLEVVLLTRDYEKRPDSQDAEYLAQQNLAGTGNTAEDEALRVAYGRDASPVMPGPEIDGQDNIRSELADRSNGQHMLYARTPDAGIVPEDQVEEAAETLTLRTGMPGTSNSIEILAAPDTETVLKGAKPRQLVISASTRESRIAAYLDSWKRRVERVGTMNFPRDAINQPGTRNPVVEVTVKSDGSLKEVIILAGSGSRELDIAAVDILKMASPFDPFPEYLRNDYDVLRFSYEWQFTRRRVGRISVP
ncbi:MAG: TonB family protein [Gammaproteobacteria bacterium]|jgi:protein TonB|nr:TonB family protein [Gammaproteobacteria bacterium]MDP6617163.1 TonB family protein [Gammaproteobacteria bacterium]MDP6695372.1 TonB family protein [Gammaproteobacteria bacterium]MDP7041355.1 TonB family protein [Gammaproteobacteria bacterium]